MGSSNDLLDGVDDDDLARWQDWNTLFRANGVAPSLNHLPASVDAPGLIADPRPWCYVAGRYRVWRDGAWAVATPQPDNAEAVIGRAWPNTVCASRGHHALNDVYGPIAVCEDCHEVTAIVPEPITGGP
jgi:hypothetical protein